MAQAALLVGIIALLYLTAIFVVLPLVRWPRKRALAAGVTTARVRLRGRCGPELELSVSEVFAYDEPALTGKGHLWVLLEGRDSENVPPWFSFDVGKGQAAVDQLPSSVVTWLRDLESEALALVREAGWRGGGLSVGVESAERIAKGGGYWLYFK
jgi:hypothetical protein